MKLPAGKYYIGDPCYVMRNRWDEVCEKMFEPGYKDDFIEIDGHKMWVHSTSYGDGIYPSNKHIAFMVDAGLIGAVPLELCDDPDETEVSYAAIITVEKDLECEYRDGVFSIGEYVIDTR